MRYACKVSRIAFVTAIRPYSEIRAFELCSFSKRSTDGIADSGDEFLPAMPLVLTEKVTDASPLLVQQTRLPYNVINKSSRSPKRSERDD